MFADAYPHIAKDFKTSNVSPVIIAAKKGHAHTVQQLLQSLPLLGCARDESGATVLICAVGNKHIDVVKVLQNGDRFIDGTDVDAVDNHRETALHRVMRQPPLDEDTKCPPEWAKVALEIVGILLSAKGNATLQNNDGETCAHVCVQNGHQEILES
jgi:ankyrin repeat protein